MTKSSVAIRSSEVVAALVILEGIQSSVVWLLGEFGTFGGWCVVALLATIWVYGASEKVRAGS